MSIPIRNVYYLLCYAWDHAQHAEMVRVDEAGTAELPDLFGHVLGEGVARLVRRGLDRDYVELEEEVAGVRGKLELAGTVKQGLLVRGRTRCRFEELRHDVQHNRVIKATLRGLLRLPDLDPDVRSRVGLAYRKLEGIADVPLSRHDFRTIQLHRNNRFYDFLLSVCLLIYDNLIVDEESGRAVFRDFREDEVQMWKVFEDFAVNFLRREQDDFRVHGQKWIQWHEARSADPADLERVPDMQADIILESPGRRIIIDTKFYAEALTGRFDRKKVDSSHLYQIFAYIENRDAADPDGPPHEGILLYPVVDRPFGFDFQLKGHPIRVRSIDLGQPWQGVHRDMLALLGD